MARIDEVAEVYVCFDAGDQAVRPGTSNWAGLMAELDVSAAVDAEAVIW